MENFYFAYLTMLPGTPQEQTWLKKRLETLSVRENYILAAAAARRLPESMSDAIDCIQSLDDYSVCSPAGSYEALGEYYLRQNTELPEDVLPHVDLDQLGQWYEDAHPGTFIGDCYVAYPDASTLQHSGHSLPKDDGWSIRMKLSSPAVPDGVWLRLPDYDGGIAGESGEVTAALDALRVKSLDECTLLEAQCILPGIRNLVEQYGSVSDLVTDANNLGYVLDEQGQGEAHWREKFAAALEYEGCLTLRFALDISQSLNLYEWVSQDDLADYAEKHLRSLGVKEELIQSGCIDLKGYAKNLLETSGYMQTSGKTGYLLRDEQSFIYRYTAPEQGGMTMQ